MGRTLRLSVTGQRNPANVPYRLFGRPSQQFQMYRFGSFPNISVAALAAAPMPTVFV